MCEATQIQITHQKETLDIKYKHSNENLIALTKHNKLKIFTRY